MSSYTLQPVGFIRSTLKGREEAPRQGPEGASAGSERVGGNAARVAGANEGARVTKVRRTRGSKSNRNLPRRCWEWRSVTN